MLYSSKDFNNKSYKIYKGGTIEGKEINGLYTEIDNYSDGEEITYNDISRNMINTNKDISNNTLTILIIETLLLVITTSLYIKNKEFV